MSNWPRVCHFETLLFGSEKGLVNTLKIYYCSDSRSDKNNKSYIIIK